MVICLERDEDLHMAQLMPLPFTVSCFSKIQIGFTFLVLAHPGGPGKRAVKRVCVCVSSFCVIAFVVVHFRIFPSYFCWHTFTTVTVDCYSYTKQLPLQELTWV